MAPDPNAPYTGPSVAHMLATHTLAQEIIARHEDSCPILDGQSLSLLRTYVMDSSATHAQYLLKELGLLREEGSDVLGPKTGKERCLVEHVIERNLEVDRHASAMIHDAQLHKGLTDDEIEMLKQWFDQGGADERIEGWKAGINA